MNERIKEHLRKYCLKQGWPLIHDFENSDNVLGILRSGNQIDRKEVGQHRWYNDYDYVVNIDGMLIGYSYFECTGDSSFKDMDLYFDLETIVEMEEFEETVVSYRAKEE